MTAKIRRSVDFDPRDLKWISRVVEERKKKDPAYSRNLLVAEAIAALREKLEGGVLTMENFAKELGFASEAVLLEDASEVVVEEGDIHWYITRLPDGRWAAWDDAEISLNRVKYFDTRQEAVAFHRTGFEAAELPEEAWVLKVPEEEVKEKVLVGDPDTGHYFLRNAGTKVPEGWEILHGTFQPEEKGSDSGIFQEEDSGLYTRVTQGESILNWMDGPDE